MIKKVTTILYVLLCCITTLNAQTTYIPDDNFEQALIDLGYDDLLDDYVLTANINTVTFLDVSGNNITDLTGIEGFSALTTLWCNSNQLASIDVSNNTALTELRCGDNQLTNLDISNNTALTKLRCNINQLISIDVSNNLGLTELFCGNNSLTSLDVSNNLALNALSCFLNQITILDLSANTALISLNCSFNQLSSLNVKNGNNTNVTVFSATYNSNLICIEVDDATYSTDNWTNIDPQSFFSEDCSNVQQTYIPDDNFEQALIDLGYDGVLDDYVATSNINTITNLDVSNKNIADLTGIEDFALLANLDCSFNQLTSLDVSNNALLNILNSSENQLTNLDVSNNISLINLNCSNNQLTALNVKNNNNVNFTNFDATNNPTLACIQVDDATYSTDNWTNIDPQSYFSESCDTYVPDDNFEQALIDLGYDTVLDDYVLTANINTITNLDVSNKNIADLTGIEDFDLLADLDCSFNQLTSLDVSNNALLNILNSSENQLTNLDVSNNLSLINLNCSNNQLTALNVKNNNNVNFTNFDSTNNPTLACIQVDDAAYSTDNWTNIDTQSFFSEDCNNVQQTYVPDDNFEQALIDLGYDIVLDDYVYTPNINTITGLNIINKNIADLTGIEDFYALTTLLCDSNQLTSLDVSNNTALTYLSCSDNQLQNLGVSNNVALTTLSCGNNQLVNLSLTNNVALTSLSCSNNQLTDLNVKNGNNSNITVFSALNNPELTCIQVDDAVYSTNNWTNIDPQSYFSESCYTYVPDDNFEQALIDLGYDDILDDYVFVENINSITNLDVSNKNIADLTGIEGFEALINLNCSSNILTDIGLQNNANLSILLCQNNQLTGLNLSNNTALTIVRCGNNQITNLDLSNNTLLTEVKCQSNQLTGLDVRNGNNTNISNADFNTTNNPNLTCIFVDDATWSAANWTNIDPNSTFVETQAQCNALSVEEAYLYTFTVYPIPAKDILTIESNINTTVRLYSITGKLLLEKNIQQGTNLIDLPLLNNGVYFLKTQNQIKKIIIK